MDLFINELSLCGQFADSRDFLDNGLPSFQDATDDVVRYQGHLYKKRNLWESLVAPGITFHDVLTKGLSRIDDRTRKYKSTLSRAIIEPFWDESSVQSQMSQYKVEDMDVTDSSVAEAAARSQSGSVALISFVRSQYVSPKISVAENGGEVVINNIWQGNQLYEILFKDGELPLADYIVARFRNGKLDFSRIDDKNGLNLINELDKDEFITAFQRFSDLSWQDIQTDRVLDYKMFTKKKRTRGYFPLELWDKGIYKFRVTRRYRCFGYVEIGKFYVVRIDLDHELSDHG